MRIETRVIPGPQAEPLGGTIFLPASKSLSNRALIAAAAAGGGRILNILDCRDTRVLATALQEMGWELQWEGSEVQIGQRRKLKKSCVLDLEDSGTGARLLMALAAVSEGEFVLDGSARLRERPMQPLIKALQDLDADIEATESLLPVRIRGRELSGTSLRIEPRSSSQFVSALLMIAPLLKGGLQLKIEGDLPSSPYLLLTRQVMQAFGAEIEHSEDLRSWNVRESSLRNTEYSVEADWSAAAFPIAAVALVGGDLLVEALDSESLQGDRKILEFLEPAGLKAIPEAGGLRLHGPVQSAFRADLLSCPDLFPALVALAACPGVGGELRNLQHLKHKESDRLQAMTENLKALGAVFELGEDRLRVVRGLKQRPEVCRMVYSSNDHRIAMAMAIVAMAAGPLEIDHPECVAKSFPSFWEFWEDLTDPERRL